MRTSIMRTRGGRSALIALGIGLALSTAACDGTSSGTPRPVSDAGSPSASGTPTGSSANASPLASIKPCDLLTASDTTPVGITTPGRPESVGGSPTCRWSTPGKFSFTLALNLDASIRTLNYAGKSPTPVSIGRHSAAELPDSIETRANTGDCSVYIAVSDSSSAQIESTVQDTSDTALSCKRAEQIAKLIDSKLP
ncbi:DUF3558 family protein [Solihabitans fulvus]|uniref:DUF3558 family protein n=1 Tax=Solihabitans fulvus TaxID=1892852 RepID=UPI001661F347|nr:DUF3558 family protein [Solihabitans fulvus]